MSLRKNIEKRIKVLKYIINVSLFICVAVIIYIGIMYLLEINSLYFSAVYVKGGFWHNFRLLNEHLSRQGFKITDLLIVFGLIGALVNTLFLHNIELKKEMAKQSILGCSASVHKINDDDRRKVLFVFSNHGKTSKILTKEWSFESKDDDKYLENKCREREWPGLDGIIDDISYPLPLSIEGMNYVGLKIECKYVLAVNKEDETELFKRHYIISPDDIFEISEEKYEGL